MQHAITTIPWGSDEGLPVLGLRGYINTTDEVDPLVDELVRCYKPYRLAGTLVELDSYVTAAHAALLISLNSRDALAPVFIYGRPRDPWPAAAATIGVDISEFFGRLPADMASWANEITATAQGCPRASEILVTTETTPTSSMLGYASSAFAPHAGYLHIPERIAVASTLAAAASGYAWHVRVRP